MRVCVGCSQSWPADAEFYNGKTALVCRACVADGVPMRRRKVRGYRSPEALREYQRAKYLRHRDAYMARMRAWYAAHREEINADRRARRALARLIDCV